MEQEKSAQQILIEGLRAIGADGLCNADLECGCGLDDFIPCGEMNTSECVAARRMKNPPKAGYDEFYTPLGPSGLDDDLE